MNQELERRQNEAILASIEVAYPHFPSGSGKLRTSETEVGGIIAFASLGNDSI